MPDRQPTTTSDGRLTEIPKKPKHIHAEARKGGGEGTIFGGVSMTLDHATQLLQVAAKQQQQQPWSRKHNNYNRVFLELSSTLTVRAQ